MGTIRREDNRLPLSAIGNEEVRKEVAKLLAIFPEGFINPCRELVICHPINPVDVSGLTAEDIKDANYRFVHGKGRNMYCNVYFLTDGCENANDVKAKVIEWWSRDAHKTQFGGRESTKIIQRYIRNGINEYLGTGFDEEDLSTIYTYLGNAINHRLTLKFIESGYNMAIISEKRK